MRERFFIIGEDTPKIRLQISQGKKKSYNVTVYNASALRIYNYLLSFVKIKPDFTSVAGLDTGVHAPLDIIIRQTDPVNGNKNYRRTFYNARLEDLQGYFLGYCVSRLENKFFTRLLAPRKIRKNRIHGRKKRKDNKNDN